MCKYHFVFFLSPAQSRVGQLKRCPRTAKETCPTGIPDPCPGGQPDKNTPTHVKAKVSTFCMQVRMLVLCASATHTSNT